jgi:hypothetical protein
MLFRYYEKAFDSIPRQNLYDIIKSRNIPDTLLKAKMNIYTQNNILIKFNSKLSKLAKANFFLLHCLICT